MAQSKIFAGIKRAATIAAGPVSHANLRVALAFLALLQSHNLAAQDERQAMREFRDVEMGSWFSLSNRTEVFPLDSSNDILFYHLDVDIAVGSPFLRGRVLVRFRSMQPGLTYVRLNLHHVFVIDSLTGSVAGFTAANDSLFILLDRPYAHGEQAEVVVHYHGVPPLANGTKGLRYTTHAGSQPVIASLCTPFLSHYWWPCKDGPGDKPDSVYVDISIPDTIIGGRPLIAVSNGTLAGIEYPPGKRKYRWRERYPIVPYYVMVAISNYDHFQQVIDQDSVSFPMDYYVFAEHRTSAEQGVANLPEAILLFSSLFGPYPFHMEKYGMTQLGYYGAIENQTNTITNNMSLSWFYVSIHELAHMWFGDMITCADWHHAWLNEGFASYCEALWDEHLYGAAGYHHYMSYFRSFPTGTLYLQNISDPFAIFLPIIYDKGAYTLHMLRNVMGDSLFFQALRTYAADSPYRYNHASTEDFQAVCESVSGLDLDYFFMEWVYGENHPIYGYSWNAVPQGNNYELTVRIKQTPNTAFPTFFTMPVDLSVSTAAGDTTLRVFNDQLDQVFNFTLGFQPLNVTLDPEQWILRQTYVLDVGTEDHSPPAKIRLSSNYPNPFNASTMLRYDLPTETHATIVIYNSLGQAVRTVFNGRQKAGSFQTSWDGRDDSGNSLASGLYVCRLRAGAKSESVRMLMLK